MTEAGQLVFDEAVWFEDTVWWVTERLSTGEVVVSDAPEASDRQVRGRVFQPHEEVTRACHALMDARGEHLEAVARMRHARRSLDWEIAAQKDRRAMAVIEKLEAAGVIARYHP